MSERLRLPLPVWQLQYQLLGGHRRMIIIFVSAVFVLAIAILGTHRLVGRPFATIGGYVLWFLTGLQAFVIILSGCNAIYRAVLRDHQSKMIESHRLTPMSNMTLAIGYLFGPTLQTLMLFVVFTATGAIVSRAAGLPVDAWIYGNFMLLIGAVMAWSFTVFIGMRPEKPISTAPIAVGIAALSVPIGIVPVLGLLTGVYAVIFGIWIMSGKLSFTTGAVGGAPGAASTPLIATFVVAGVALAYTMFWIAMAAVKYRRPDLPAINGARGLALLTMSLLTGAIGLVAFKHFTTSSPALNEFHNPSVERTQWLVTLICGLLLAAVITAGAVRCQVLGSRGTALRGRSDRMSPLTIAILTAAMICAIMAGAGSPIWPPLLPTERSDLFLENVTLYAPVWGWTFAACLLATLTFRSVLEIGYRLLSSPKVLVAVFLIVAWAVPPMIDSVRMEFVRESQESADYSWLTASCPPGLLVTIWVPLDIQLWPGLAIQIGVLLILILVARHARRKEEVKSR